MNKLLAVGTGKFDASVEAKNLTSLKNELARFSLNGGGVASEAILGDSLLNQMDDTSTYLLSYDCRAYYNIAFQQTISIHLGKC